MTPCDAYATRLETHHAAVSVMYINIKRPLGFEFSSLYTAPKTKNFNYHCVEIFNHGAFLPTLSDINMARFLFI